MRTAASTCVSCALGCALIAACTASAEDVRPPDDQLFFPTGLAVSARANVLFVANSNSELRYDSGTIAVIDLAVVEKVIRDWTPPPPPITDPPTAPINPTFPSTCKPDTDRGETLVCDETMFIKVGAGVRIGNFATDIALQEFTTKVRVLVPTRGDPSVAWADYDGDKLSCGGSIGFSLCDDAHRLASLLNDPDQPPIPDEPFAVFAATQPGDPPAGPGDPPALQQGFAIVTHLTSGTISLIDAPENGTVQISDVVTGLFGLDPTTGLVGASGVAGRSPGAPDDIVYVGSRSENRIATFTVGRPENHAPAYLLPSGFFFLNAVGSNSGVGGSVDTRGMQFSPPPDGKQHSERMYVVNRRPPTVQIYDTATNTAGAPRNVLTGASDICRQASTVAVLDAGAGERAYVTCFQDGEVYVVDPRGQSQVEDIVTVGRGPYSIVAAKDHKQLFVSNFLEDTIAVIDADPDSPNRNRVVLRIGRPRAQ